MSAVFRRCLIAVAAFAMSGIFGSSLALAGTTGSVTGTVTDGKTHLPLAGVRVEIASPAQASATVTDASGRFTFISLAPDTYAITLGKTGYERLVAAGITVQADQELTEQLALQPSLQQIGHVTARSPLDLVKPGTISDVYSVGTAVAAAAAPLGGGGALNSAYSAIASVPGVFVPPGQQGVNQSVFIRGGYYDQIGYEYDGVPMNRSFDNYPGHSAATLGEQELQVYTGGGGAGASATGLAGYINQVVRTGTYPGFVNFSGRLGAPTFDHDLQFEAGGSTPSRSFSYYAGALGSNQGFRYFDNQNGAGLTALYPNAIGPSNQTTNLHYYPAVYPNCNPADLSEPTLTYAGGATQWSDPGCFSTMNPVYGNIAQIRDRDAVANFHFAVPHRDLGHDDVQVLYTNSAQYRQYYSGLGDVSPGTRAYLAPVVMARPADVSGRDGVPRAGERRADRVPVPGLAGHALLQHQHRRARAVRRRPVAAAARLSRRALGHAEHGEASVPEEPRHERVRPPVRVLRVQQHEPQRRVAPRARQRLRRIELRLRDQLAQARRGAAVRRPDQRAAPAQRLDPVRSRVAAARQQLQLPQQLEHADEQPHERHAVLRRARGQGRQRDRHVRGRRTGAVQRFDHARHVQEADAGPGGQLRRAGRPRSPPRHARRTRRGR